MICRDKVGQEIQVGSYIVYGHLLGRCGALKLGKVICIQPGPPEFPYWKNEHEPAPPTWRVGVLGLDQDWSKQLRLTKGTCQFPSRMLVINPDTQLTEEQRTKLQEES